MVPVRGLLLDNPTESLILVAEDTRFLRNDRSLLTLLKVWAAKSQHPLWLGAYPPQKDGRATETLPNTPVKRFKVLIVVYDLSLVNGYDLTLVLFHQFSVHSAESLCFFLNLLFLCTWRM